MNSINEIEDIKEMYTCECGSIFFDEFNAKTFIDSQFISYGPNSTLTACDRTVPIVKCILCNKVHIPRTSFAGRNALDRQVQLYATLYNQITTYNESLSTTLSEEAIYGEPIKEVVEDVKAKPDSTECNKDVVQKPQKRSSTRKTDKK